MTARGTVIGLLLAITLALLAALLVPQQGADGKAPLWLARLPEELAPLKVLGLDHIVASPWFALLVLFFALSLTLSTVEQFRSARALIGRKPAGAQGEWLEVASPAAAFQGRLRLAGYRPGGGAEGLRRYLKHGAGYWGSFLLHLGLVLVVLFSLVYVVSQHRILARLVGDEVTVLSQENTVVKQGLYPLNRQLPASITLCRVEPHFYSNDKLQSLASELYFTKQTGDLPQRVEVALSDKGSFGSFLVYQMSQYGLAFNLDITLPGGEFRKAQLLIDYPGRRGQAGYGELALPGTGYRLKGKFLPDAEGGGLEPRSPRLTLRLMNGQHLVGEANFRAGERGMLGPCPVRLSAVNWWTQVMLDDSRGMFGIFTGFAVLLAGVLISYCLVPREVLVREEGGAVLAQQYVRRFAPFYREEFEALVYGGQPEAGS